MSLVLRQLSVLVTVLLVSPLFANDTLADAFVKGKIVGNLQAWYINTSFEQAGNNPPLGTKANPVARSEAAVGGILQYNTKQYYNTEAFASFVSSNLMGQNPNAQNTQNSYVSTSSSVVNSINYNVNVLAEAYIKTQYDKTTVSLGEQFIDTPLATSVGGARIFYKTFRAFAVKNSDIKDTNLHFMYLNGMQTNHSAIYGGNVPNSMGGTNNAQASINLGFQSMDSVAFGTAANAIMGGTNNPVFVLSAVNKTTANVTSQLWLYRAENFFNALWFQSEYEHKINLDYTIFAGIQYLYEGGIGNAKQSFKNGTATQNGNSYSLAEYCNGQGVQASCASGILSNYAGGIMGLRSDNAKLFVAYSQTQFNPNAAMDGSLFMPWGGSQTKLYTSTMLANGTAGGSKATLWQAEYTFNDFFKGLKLVAAYGLYAADYSASDAYYTANVYIYKPMDGLGNIGNVAYYGEMLYNINKNLTVRWRYETNHLMGQTLNFPQAATESRLMGIYRF